VTQEKAKQLATSASPDQRWVIVDTETDGLIAPIHVIEIAAQLMEGSQPCGEPFQIYLNHDVPIPAEATAIHGYTREFLREHGQTPIKAHEAFRQYARDYPIAAHNLAYDWNRALEPEWIRLGLPTIGQRGFCTMLLSRRVIANLASFRLDALKQHFRLGEGQSHKALNDVQTVVKLFTTVIKPRLEFAGLTTFLEWVEFSRQQPISKCLLQTNPQQQTTGVQTYYLDAGKSKWQQQSASNDSANLKQLLKQLGKQVKTQGELTIETIFALKTSSDANKFQENQTWINRWLKRVIQQGRIDAGEKLAFEAALVNRMRKPKPEWELRYNDGDENRNIDFDTPKKIFIVGHRFCFTGKAAFGTRAECERAVVERAGICEKRPHLNADYLVVGSLGNPSGKLEEAAELRRCGDPILLVTEQVWLSAIQQAAKLPETLIPKPKVKIPRKRLPRPPTKSPCGGISLTMGIGINGPFLKVEKIPLQTPQNQTEL
jgi:DNA polymerase III epsilon subunit-like protein